MLSGLPGESMQTTCPTCQRKLNLKTNRFGDLIYPRHKMARLGDYTSSTRPKSKQPFPRDLREELFAANPLAAASYDLDCPMSGQPK